MNKTTGTKKAPKILQPATQAEDLPNEAQFLKAIQELTDDDRKLFLVIMEGMITGDENSQMAIRFMEIASETMKEPDYFRDAMQVLARALNGNELARRIVMATIEEAAEEQG